MADSNAYHIYIHFDGADDNKSAVADTGASSSGTDKAPDSGLSAGERKIANKLKSMVSFAAIKSTADRLISYDISQISLQSGAAEYEQRMSTVYGILSQTVGAGAALAGGAFLGGPAGLAVAAIGVVASGINKLIGIEQKRQTLETERSLENISINMANVRAGTTGRRSNEQ